MLASGNLILEQQVQYWRVGLKPTLTQGLERTPADKLDWAPAENMIKLGQVFLHIAECSDWWYGEVMLGVPATELATGTTPDKATIARHLEDHWQRMERFFADSPDKLALTYTHPLLEKHNFRPTGAWIFMHLLEHDIHHRSQIHQYLRILGITPPEI